LHYIDHIQISIGFGHLRGEYAYKAAMKQLEDRYGDTEVIANAFIKKALEWPTLKPGDSKALDEFSLLVCFSISKLFEIVHFLILRVTIHNNFCCKLTNEFTKFKWITS
jgi:hypothetical protein